jgi:NAD(P)-dependent dehydrogenase (short-subunit alcohol dehydrogenase family)
MDIESAGHAFVTGGASGLGLGIAQALWERGVKVTLADANRERLAEVCRDIPQHVRGVFLDVRDRAGWASAKADAQAAFGPVDILVNNAGIAPNGVEFADMDADSFDQIIAINLMGVFNGVHCFAADMRGRGHGHIVNTASMAGISTAIPGVGAYATAKFGVVGMSETLRHELAAHGVGVSILCPGYVSTNLAENTVKLGGRIRAVAMKMPESTVSSRDVGEMVVRGIAGNAPFIITHPDNWPRVEERHDVLRAAFEAAAVPAG